MNLINSTGFTMLSFGRREGTPCTVFCQRSKGKEVPLQAWYDPEGSRKLRSPYFMTTAQDGGRVVNFTHRPPLPLGNNRGTHFC